MNSKEKFCEADMYKPIKDFFISSGYMVRGEVKGCDIVAVKDDEIIMIELKKFFNLKLIYQAMDRQKITDNVFMAIPRIAKFKDYKNIVKLVKRLNLGLIVVSMDSPIKLVEVIVYPSRSTVKKQKKATEKILKEATGRTFDINIGGTSGKKINTVFREKSIKIACALEKEGVASAKDLVKLYNFEKDTSAILYKNHYNWFTRVSRGKYCLNDKGRYELEEQAFEKIVSHYREVL